MNIIRSLISRMRAIFRGGKLDREMAEEIQVHLEMETERNMANGMTRKEARSAAKRAFGGVEQIQEDERDARGFRWLEDLIRDARFSGRVLGRSPSFTIIAVATLSLCLGVNVTLFSLLNSILLNPYSYPQSERVVNVGMVWPKWQWGEMVQEIAPLTFLEIEESATSFSAFGFIDQNDKSDLLFGGRNLRLNVARVTLGVWSVAGARPAIGRFFEKADLENHNSDIAVLSDELWNDIFDRDPAIIGQRIQIDDHAHEIIGVMPAGFSLASNRTRIWLPKIFSPDERTENGRGMAAFQAIGRLRDGVSIDQARDELQALYSSFLDAHPERLAFAKRTGETYGVAPLSRWVSDRSSGSMLVSLQFAAGIILLLGCLNIGSLLLVRGHERLREMALRNALGASRIRIAQQLAMETVVLFLCGAMGATVLAAVAFHALPIHFHLDEIIPYGQSVEFDVGVVALTFGLSFLTGLFTGSLPILYATRRNLSSILQELSHQTTGSPGRRWTQSFLVSMQVALALVLLTAAGITARNLHGLLAEGFGVATDHRLVASVALPSYRFGSGFAAATEKINPFKAQALDRIRNLPGVLSASVSNRVPLSGDWPVKSRFQVPGHEPLPGEKPVVAFIYEIFPDYFKTLGMPILRGRDIASTDVAGTAPVAMISKSIAERFYTDGDAIGQRIKFYNQDCEIVGVVDETQNVPFSMGNAPAIYLAATQWPLFNDEAVFVAHTALPPVAMAESVMRTLVAIDPTLSVCVTDLESLQEGATLNQRAPMEIAVMFSGLALLLSLLGVYAVLASSVAQRSREFGIRMAVGAHRRTIFRAVLIRGSFLALVGIAAGALLSVPLLKAIKPLMARSDAARPDILLYACALIFAATLLASFIPARHATQADPIQSLRA